MALKQSKQIVAGAPIPTPVNGVGVTPVTGEYVIPAGGLAINDVIEMGGLPVGCVVVDAIVHNSAMGAGATADFGYLTGTYGKNDGARTCGNEFNAAVAVAAAGIVRLAKPQFDAAQTDETTKGWGLKVTGAVWPAAGVVRATLFVRPAPTAMT